MSARRCSATGCDAPPVVEMLRVDRQPFDPPRYGCSAAAKLYAPTRALRATSRSTIEGAATPSGAAGDPDLPPVGSSIVEPAAAPTRASEPRWRRRRSIPRAGVGTAPPAPAHPGS